MQRELGAKRSQQSCFVILLSSWVSNCWVYRVEQRAMWQAEGHKKGEEGGAGREAEREGQEEKGGISKSLICKGSRPMCTQCWSPARKPSSAEQKKEHFKMGDFQLQKALKSLVETDIKELGTEQLGNPYKTAKGHRRMHPVNIVKKIFIRWEAWHRHVYTKKWLIPQPRQPGSKQPKDCNGKDHWPGLASSRNVALPEICPCKSACNRTCKVTWKVPCKLCLWGKALHLAPFRHTIVKIWGVFLQTGGCITPLRALVTLLCATFYRGGEAATKKEIAVSNCYFNLLAIQVEILKLHAYSYHRQGNPCKFRSSIKYECALQSYIAKKTLAICQTLIRMRCVVWWR